MPRQKLEQEVKQVERYEYLLVEYLKEVSNEITYLLLIVCSLFLLVLLDIIPAAEQIPQYYLVKMVFMLFIVGGFMMFGMANIAKRRIEMRFEKIFSK